MLAARDAFALKCPKPRRSRFPLISAFSYEKLGKMDTERYEARRLQKRRKRFSTAKCSAKASSYRRPIIIAKSDYGFIDHNDANWRFPMIKNPSMITRALDECLSFSFFFFLSYIPESFRWGRRFKPLALCEEETLSKKGKNVRVLWRINRDAAENRIFSLSRSVDARRSGIDVEGCENLLIEVRNICRR